MFDLHLSLSAARSFFWSLEISLYARIFPIKAISGAHMNVLHATFASKSAAKPDAVTADITPAATVNKTEIMATFFCRRIFLKKKISKIGRIHARIDTMKRKMVLMPVASSGDVAIPSRKIPSAVTLKV